MQHKIYGNIYKYNCSIFKIDRNIFILKTFTEPSMNKNNNCFMQWHCSVCIIVLKTVQVYKKFMEKEYTFER